MLYTEQIEKFHLLTDLNVIYLTETNEASPCFRPLTYISTVGAV